MVPTSLMNVHSLTGGCVLFLLSQETRAGALCGCALGLQCRVVRGEAMAEEVCSACQLCVARGAEEAVLHARDMPGRLQEMSV